MPSLAAKKARTCEMKYLSLSYKQNQTIQWARRTENEQLLGEEYSSNIICHPLSCILLFLPSFFGWSLATLFLEKHDIKVSTTFSSSTKKLKLRQFVPKASWLLFLILTIAYALTSYYQIWYHKCFPNKVNAICWF